MNKIEKITLANKLMYDNNIILEYTIEYPQITSSQYELGRRIFNRYNKDKAERLERYARTTLYREARNLYEYNKQNGYPIMTYQVMLTYEIMLNAGNLLSFYQDEYLFTGGAHGITKRTSQNWNLQLARQVPLQFFYPREPYYVINILKEINTQIEERIAKEGPIFFDNYCQLVLDTFNLESYYITPTSTVVYFQQYDIAPYSTGIPTFEIKR